jgi:DNA-binding NarL/FixJ family response regulator
MLQATSVALIDDHLLFRQSMSAWFATDPDLVLVGTDRTVPEFVARSVSAAVVLLDLALGDDSLVEDNIRTLRGLGAGVVVVSANAAPTIVSRAMLAGALGYVPKDASTDELRAAIIAAAAGCTYMTQDLATALLTYDEPGRPQLSPQELRTIQLYAGGMPMKSVARRLGVSPGAVKSYIDRIREKYERVGRDAPTKVDLYRRAVEDGYLSTL